MVTRNIPPEEWAEYLDELGNLEENVLVSVEAIGNDVGDQVVASQIPLLGMTLVQKGSGAGQIEIMLGDSPDQHISHVIMTPTRMAALETEEGELQTLQIEAEGAPTTLVHFQGTDEDTLLEDEDEDDED